MDILTFLALLFLSFQLTLVVILVVLVAVLAIVFNKTKLAKKALAVISKFIRIFSDDDSEE